MQKGVLIHYYTLVYQLMTCCCGASRYSNDIVDRSRVASAEPWLITGKQCGRRNKALVNRTGHARRRWTADFARNRNSLLPSSMTKHSELGRCRHAQEREDRQRHMPRVSRAGRPMREHSHSLERGFFLSLFFQTSITADVASFGMPSCVKFHLEWEKLCECYQDVPADQRKKNSLGLHSHRRVVPAAGKDPRCV